MNVLFRLDASRGIGAGHFARCRVLADALAEHRDAECVFVGRDPDRILQRGLQMTPHRLLTLPEPADNENLDELPHAHWLGRSQAADLRLSLSLMQASGLDGVDWLVVDHYGLDERWQRAVRPYAKWILAIDDLADRSHAVDLVLDQNLREDCESAYLPLLATHACLLCGPRYALLRSEFRGLNVNAPRSGVLVAFGGTDSGNWTERVVRSLLKEDRFQVPLKVIIAGTHPARRVLLDMTAQDTRLSIEVDTANVAGLMREARLAIGAGGSMTWERCAAGLPALAWPIADNQRGILAAAATAGVLELVPEPDVLNNAVLGNRVIDLYGDLQRLDEMRRIATGLVDGFGVMRLLEAMAGIDGGLA